MQAIAKDPSLSGSGICRISKYISYLLLEPDILIDSVKLFWETTVKVIQYSIFK